jgi:hypothetical protein
MQSLKLRCRAETLVQSRNFGAEQKLWCKAETSVQSRNFDAEPETSMQSRKLRCRAKKFRCRAEPQCRTSVLRLSWQRGSMPNSICNYRSKVGAELLCLIWVSTLKIRRSGLEKSYQGPNELEVDNRGEDFSTKDSPNWLRVYRSCLEMALSMM